MLFQTDNFFCKDSRKIFFSRLFRKIFLEDWLMKLVALVITLALWFGVTGLREPITIRQNGIALQPRLSNNLEITNSPITEVSLVLTGDRRKIDQIKSENLIVSIDLTDVQPGEHIIQLTPETVNIELPNGIKIDEIQPNKISVRLETVEEREIPVRVETEGSVTEGFEVYGTPVILPAKVRVRGPSSFVKSLEFVSTEKINLDKKQGDFTAQQVPINIVAPKVTKLDATVDVSFRIGEKRIEKDFTVSVPTDEGAKKATFTLYGTRSQLKAVTSENIQIEVVKNDSGNIVPRPVLPADLEGKVEIREPKFVP
jgi:YbbR domain-containing protein